MFDVCVHPRLFDFILSIGHWDKLGENFVRLEMIDDFWMIFGEKFKGYLSKKGEYEKRSYSSRRVKIIREAKNISSRPGNGKLNATALTYKFGS